MTEIEKPRIIIVDENDKIIGHKDRGTLEKEDIYRVSALWATNNKGEILLARRAFSKSRDPGRWGPAVAGTVDEGETYIENIVKEAEEEVGLKDIEPMLGPKVEVDREYHYFVQWYTLSVDGDILDFTIQEDEVEEIKWFSPQELKKELQEHPEEFLSGMNDNFELFSS